MRNHRILVLPLLALALIGPLLQAKLAQAQSTVSGDKKDQEIELLKLEVKQLERTERS